MIHAHPDLRRKTNQAFNDVNMEGSFSSTTEGTRGETIITHSNPELSPAISNPQPVQPNQADTLVSWLEDES